MEMEEAAVRIQKLFRCRLARKRVHELAQMVYQKAYDETSGYYYYYHSVTGDCTWEKPKCLHEEAPEEDYNDYNTSTAPDEELYATYMNEEAEMVNYEDGDTCTNVERYEEGYIEENSTAFECAPNDNVQNTYHVNMNADELIQSSQECDDDNEGIDKKDDSVNSREKWERDRKEGIEFLRKRAKCKLLLEKKYESRLKKIERKNVRLCMKEKKNMRKQRNAMLIEENRLLKKALFDGTMKPRLDGIRAAAIQGDAERVEELIKEGQHFDSESAMGLTPLYGACRSEQLDVVKVLLKYKANVNKQHPKSGRSCFMEACSQTSAPVVRELLRSDARLDIIEKNGKSVEDITFAKDIKKILRSAKKQWSTKNSSLFPEEFRRASLTLMLISLRQRNVRAKKLKELKSLNIQLKSTLERALVDSKIRYDEDMKVSNIQVTLYKRKECTFAADKLFDDSRREVLKKLHTAVIHLYDACRPGFLPVNAIYLILSYCQRHWFERTASLNTKTMKTDICINVIQPTKPFEGAEKLPTELFERKEECCLKLEDLFESLSEVDRLEVPDVESGVCKNCDSGKSTAVLNITVIEGEHLPLRGNLTNELIDPYVKISVSQINDKEYIETVSSEPRYSDRNPVWCENFQIKEIPSIHGEILVQVIDKKRSELSGEIRISLRSLLDQKEHDEWYTLPLTLRQQLIEKMPRKHPARIHLCVQFIHASSIVLTREIQREMRKRKAILIEVREYIGQVLEENFSKLSNPNSSYDGEVLG